MAIKDIDTLRKIFPQYYRDQDQSIDNLDNDETGYIQVPTTEPIVPSDREDEEEDYSDQLDNPDFVSDKSIEGFLEDEISRDDGEGVYPIDSPTEQEIEVFGGHPGGLSDNDQSKISGKVTNIETRAFYLPFHYYKTYWGIYILPEGILSVCRELKPLFDMFNLDKRDRLLVAKHFLYHHEYYHHCVESFATRLETIITAPCYVTAFTNLYKNTFGTSNCIEETCANSYSREQIIKRLCESKSKKSVFNVADLNYASGYFADPKKVKQIVRDNLNRWFGDALPGYAEAADTNASWSKKEGADLNEAGVVQSFLDNNLQRNSLSNSFSRDSWNAGGLANKGFGNINSKIKYLIRRGSPLFKRMPTNIRTCTKSRNFIKKLTRKKIARYLRPGKGSHKIYESFCGGYTASIPVHPGQDIPKGTMKGILKSLNCGMTIEEVLS